MPLSYKNIIDTNQLADALTTGDFSKVIKKKNSNLAKYIKGYADQTAIEALGNAIDPNMSLETLRRTFGLENKKLDAYDPYHTSDAKKEEFWFYNGANTNKMDGKDVQKLYDEDTNTFKRGLYSQSELGNFRQNDFWYEDPFVPSFELFFDNDSSFFNIQNKENSLQSFINKYKGQIVSYENRLKIWEEFNNVFWKIFEKKLANETNSQRNKKNKTYYITKIAGLEFLNKKIIEYGKDKISITLNEDIAMFAWYLSELYNNIAYSYKDQRYMFPENVLRFNMIIKINDIRNFQIPQSNNISGQNVPVDKKYLDSATIKNVISPKSQIVYELCDCNFNFFESKNYGSDIQIGGYESPNYTPQNLTFDIYFKSVTRYSNFPLLNNYPKINAWQNQIFTDKYKGSTETGTLHNLYDNLDRIKYEGGAEPKNYANQLLSKGAQTIVNAGTNYMDNLETNLREVRGSAVNNLLQQFRNATKINKIEPDNVYNANFNNRISFSNFGKEVASGLLNGLETTVKNAVNF